MRVFETVDRLIIVADDANMRLIRQQLYDALLRSVEVLKFVNEDVRELRALRSGRVGT